MAMVVVSGSFDDLKSRHVRFLHEASKLGELYLLLWSDRVVRVLEGKEPRFPQEERSYMLQALRYLSRLMLVSDLDHPDALPATPGLNPAVWAVEEKSDSIRRREVARLRGIEFRVLTQKDLQGFPSDPVHLHDASFSRPKVVATGCYDWLHSGHVRFFEEASQLGELYVIIGHDENLRLLKGKRHPMFPQEERRYMVQAMRYVHWALVTSGTGWMDAEPEIALIKPDIYAVNEDGDRPEKQAFCEAHGIRYVVLKRVPKDGLQSRQSTDLRGF